MTRNNEWKKDTRLMRGTGERNSLGRSEHAMVIGNKDTGVYALLAGNEEEMNILRAGGTEEVAGCNENDSFLGVRKTGKKLEGCNLADSRRYVCLLEYKKQCIVCEEGRCKLIGKSNISRASEKKVARKNDFEMKKRIEKKKDNNLVDLDALINNTKYALLNEREKVIKIKNQHTYNNKYSIVKMEAIRNKLMMEVIDNKKFCKRIKYFTTENQTQQIVKRIKYFTTENQAQQIIKTLKYHTNVSIYNQRQSDTEACNDYSLKYDNQNKFDAKNEMKEFTMYCMYKNKTNTSNITTNQNEDGIRKLFEIHLIKVLKEQFQQNIANICCLQIFLQKSDLIELENNRKYYDHYQVKKISTIMNCMSASNTAIFDNKINLSGNKQKHDSINKDTNMLFNNTANFTLDHLNHDNLNRDQNTDLNCKIKHIKTISKEQTNKINKHSQSKINTIYEQKKVKIDNTCFLKDKNCLKINRQDNISNIQCTNQTGKHLKNTTESNANNNKFYSLNMNSINIIKILISFLLLNKIATRHSLGSKHSGRHGHGHGLHNSTAHAGMPHSTPHFSGHQLAQAGMDPVHGGNGISEGPMGMGAVAANALAEGGYGTPAAMFGMSPAAAATMGGMSPAEIAAMGGMSPAAAAAMAGMSPAEAAAISGSPMAAQQALAMGAMGMGNPMLAAAMSGSPMAAQQAIAMGQVGPAAARAAEIAQAQKAGAAQGMGQRMAAELAGEVVGGGLSGYNMGGANNPRAASSNVFHSPLEAALHEAGPFGSQGMLSANMAAARDPTIQQRVEESLDPVHDDTLKVNLAKKQQMEEQLALAQQDAQNRMNEAIKQNASRAASRDAMSSRLNAEALRAQAPGGNLSAVVPQTNKTFGEMIEEQLAKAQHAAQHARNPDLYELENAAERIGFPPPTAGHEMVQQAMNDMAKKLYEEAAQARANEEAEETERRIGNMAAAREAAAAKAQQDIANRIAEQKAAAEGRAVQAQDAMEAEAALRDAQRLAALQAGEAEAAAQATAGDLRKQEAQAAAIEAKATAAGERAAVQAAQGVEAENALAGAAQRAAAATGEAIAAGIGEGIFNAKVLERNAAALQERAIARNDLAQKSLGEAMAAQMGGAERGQEIKMRSNLIAAAGEAAVAQEAMQRGAQYHNAALEAGAIANKSIAEGSALAQAAAESQAIAEEARARAAGEANAARALQTRGEIAAAKERQLAEAARTEGAIAKAVDGARKAVAEAMEKQEAQGAQNEAAEAEAAAQSFNIEDAYKILGTIPDDADTVAISNSSIAFPLKIFKTAKAHNQAEAGALAAQNKIKDDIRGKVTADKFDSPLNIIKGEGGYLNVPENAQNIEVESGRVYFSEEAQAAMEKEGLDISHLEHKINTDERADMGIGIGYYVADAGGMKIEIPSPGNPDPARVLTGNGRTLDISKAEGMDIEMGELKLEKWRDYLRKVRPQVNMAIQSSGRESIIEAVVDDDCVKQALRDADAMFNTKSEIITNPDGATFLKVTPPYGVSEQVPYDEAVFNLDRIKQSCRISHGQLGVSTMQESDLKSEKIEKGHARISSLNIAAESGKMEAALSEEKELQTSGLEMATSELQTHDFVTEKNAFDNQIHVEKQEIVEEGCKIIEQQTGISKEELEHKGEVRQQIKEEAETIQNMVETKSGDGSMNVEVKEEQMIMSESLRTATRVKEDLIMGAVAMSKAMGMSQEEYISAVSKVSLNTFSSFYYYAAHSSNTHAYEMYEKAKAELRTFFGTHTEAFMRMMYQDISSLTGFGDPNETVIIKKETHVEPVTIRTARQHDNHGNQITVVQRKEVPVTNIIRIPITKIIKNNTGHTIPLTPFNSNVPAGERLLHALTSGSQTSSSSSSSSSSGKISVMATGPNGFGGNGQKIKLGANGMVLGTNSDIQQMLDLASIGHITERNDMSQNMKRMKRSMIEGTGKISPFASQVKQITIGRINPNNCNVDMGNPTKSNNSNQKHEIVQLSNTSHTVSESSASI